MSVLRTGCLGVLNALAVYALGAGITLGLIWIAARVVKHAITS
jgi:hypothetical protein